MKARIIPVAIAAAAAVIIVAPIDPGRTEADKAFGFEPVNEGGSWADEAGASAADAYRRWRTCGLECWADGPNADVEGDRPAEVASR